LKDEAVFNLVKLTRLAGRIRRMINLGPHPPHE